MQANAFRRRLEPASVRFVRLSRRDLLLAASAAPFRERAGDLARIVCPLAVAPTYLIPGLSQSLETRLVGSKIYSGLCRCDAQGVPHPELAAGWEVSADATTYVFHLRPDLVWHDSGAVTAADVVFSIDRFHRHFQPQLGLDRIAAIRALDAATVMVRLAAPFAPLLRQLDALSAPIVPQHVHDRPGFAVDPRQTRPIGTGPFWMTEWLRLRRFEWFAGPKPSIAEIAFPVEPDAAARIDLLTREPGVLVGQPVALRDGLVAGSQPMGTIAGLRLNAADPALSDQRVRLGLACSIDHAAILRDVWLGLGRVAAGPALGDSQPQPQPAYDPRAASDYFAQAGLRPDDSGIRLRLSHLVPPGEPWQRLATRLRIMLAHSGIDLVAEAVSQDACRSRVAAGAYQTAGFLAPLSDTLAPDAATRVWLVEPAWPVAHDRRLSLPGGVFTDFAAASLSAGPVSIKQ